MRSILMALMSLTATPAMAATTIFTENFDTVRPQTYLTGNMVGNFKVAAGDMDVVGDLNGQFFSCGGKNNCADTNGNSPVTLSAMLDLVSGNTYHVSFDLAGNGPRDSNLYSLAAGLGHSPYYRFDTAPGTPFHTVSFDYIATATGSAELQFQSLNIDAPGYWGPIIDNVKVENMTVTSAIPEPSSWALLIVGFVGISAATRHRRRMSNVVLA